MLGQDRLRPNQQNRRVVTLSSSVLERNRDATERLDERNVLWTPELQFLFDVAEPVQNAIEIKRADPLKLHDHTNRVGYAGVDRDIRRIKEMAKPKFSTLDDFVESSLSCVTLGDSHRL
jgi:hypothetical protein